MNRTSQGNTHTLKGYILHRSLSAPTLLFPPPHLHLPPLQEPETEENSIDPMLMFLLSYRHVWCCAWPQTATETMPQSHNPPKHNPSHSQTKESHPEAVGAHPRGSKSCPNVWFSPNWGKMFAPLLAWAVGSCEPCPTCLEQAAGPDLHPALVPTAESKVLRAPSVPEHSKLPLWEM